MLKDNNPLVPGFMASAVAAGLKKNKGLDIGLIYSENDAVAAGVFTSNRVKAAPVILTREHLENHKARAILANAGNANACTGQTGLANAREMARLVADELGINFQDVLVASTGVIGKPLDMDLVSAAIPSLSEDLSPTGIPLVARAIMTTDSFPKASRFKGIAGKKEYTIFGVAKGAGMIMPDMATMLCFVVTDINIEAENLKKVLGSAVDTTFNRITVDGDTSTNDMALVLANGMAGNGPLTEAELNVFADGLGRVMGELARMIVRDGEGATKLVDIKVIGAGSRSDASVAARTVANSSLVKTAFYGQDPNWGRIMAALGKTGVIINEEMVDILVDDILIVSGGTGCGGAAEARAAKHMAEKEFTLTIKLNQGSYEDMVTTCDLTHEYVSINADYRT